MNLTLRLSERADEQLLLFGYVCRNDRSPNSQSDDQATRVRHFIVDLVSSPAGLDCHTDVQYLWQILSCIIATVSVAMVIRSAISLSSGLTVQVLTKLFRQSRATQRLSSFRTLSSTFSEASCPHDSTRLSGLRRLLSRSESTSGCACSPEQPKGAMYQLQDKLTGVALRISLYPVTLIVVNVIVTSRSDDLKQVRS